MSGGRSSQRKGRNGEREIRDILKAAGWSAVCKDIYAPFDIDWEGGDCEVKRKASGMKEAYDAFANGARAFFFRADRKEWLIVHTLDDYIQKHGPQFTITPEGRKALAEAEAQDLQDIEGAAV